MIAPNPKVQLLTTIRDRQNGCHPIALTQGSKRDPIPPFKFLDLDTSTGWFNLHASLWAPILGLQKQMLGPTQVYECQMGVELWTLVFPISKHFIHDKLYIFWTYVAIHLIWAYFHRNRTILKIWPPYKGQCPFLILSFISILNATSYGYHVIYFFTPYNKRNNMTCIKAFWILQCMKGGSLSSLEGVCIILFTLYRWNFIISASQGIFLDKAHKNSRII